MLEVIFLECFFVCFVDVSRLVCLNHSLNKPVFSPFTKKSSHIMTSAYGTLVKPNTAIVLDSILPVKDCLTSGKPVVITTVDRNNERQVAVIHDLLNEEIRAGNSYPQEHELSRQQFEDYFLSADAFVVTNEQDHSVVYGVFYIKPNFPGRCSHICNGGFITNFEYRRQGVAKLMTKWFIKLAPMLGYRASMFNLVFENNIASVQLWRKHGFKEIGRIPGAGRLKKRNDNGEEFIDAIMFYYDFAENEK
jgi:ribosomal protein S18 acetylase RimI-like enzyme